MSKLSEALKPCSRRVGLYTHLTFPGGHSLNCTLTSPARRKSDLRRHYTVRGCDRLVGEDGRERTDTCNALRVLESVVGLV